MFQTSLKQQSKTDFTEARGGFLQRKCACGGAIGPQGECAECKRKRMLGAQARLIVSAPEDAFELEAERIAEAVVSPPPVVSGTRSHAYSSPAPQLRTETSTSPSSQSVEVPSEAHEALKSDAQPLDRHTRDFMEFHLHHDFGHVRVHNDGKASAAARAVNAQAYTLGSDIVFGDGEYAPWTREGQHLVAHELAHVVQQGGNRASGIQRRISDTVRGTAQARRGQDPNTEQGSVDGGPGVPPGGRMIINVLGSELFTSGTEIDRRIVQQAQVEVERHEGTRLIRVTSMSDMVGQLEQRVARGGCVGELRIWNHARPRVGGQRVAGRDYLGTRWLLQETNRDLLNRLRRVFCCQASMHWLGCGSAAVVAPEVSREESVAPPGWEARFERRYEHVGDEYFGDVFQSPEQAAAYGANLLAARFNSVDVQNWADATCTHIVAANDFVFFDPGSERLFFVGFGGGFEPFSPSATAVCPCDPQTGRVGGEARGISELTAALVHPCGIEALGIIHRELAVAQQWMHLAVDALEALMDHWGLPPTSSLEQATSFALLSAFHIQSDKSLWALMGVDLGEIAVRDANDRMVANIVLTVARDILATLSRFGGAGACDLDPSSTLGTPCFTCASEQLPRCEPHGDRGTRAFVTPPTPAITLCPSFFRSGRTDPAHILIHETAHFHGNVDELRGVGLYGCPLQARRPHGSGQGADLQGSQPETPSLTPFELSQVADSYACFAHHIAQHFEAVRG